MTTPPTEDAERGIAPLSDAAILAVRRRFAAKRLRKALRYGFGERNVIAQAHLAMFISELLSLDPDWGFSEMFEDFVNGGSSVPDATGDSRQLGGNENAE